MMYAQLPSVTLRPDGAAAECPVFFRVSAPLNGRQQAEAQYRLNKFLTDVSLSLGEAHVVSGTMGDGTKYRLSYTGGIVAVTLDPPTGAAGLNSRRGGIGIHFTDLDGLPVPGFTTPQGPAPVILSRPEGSAKWVFSVVDRLRGGRHIWTSADRKHWLVYNPGDPIVYSADQSVRARPDLSAHSAVFVKSTPAGEKLIYASVTGAVIRAYWCDAEPVAGLEEKPALAEADYIGPSQTIVGAPLTPLAGSPMIADADGAKVSYLGDDGDSLVEVSIGWNTFAGALELTTSVITLNIKRGTRIEDFTFGGEGRIGTHAECFPTTVTLNYLPGNTVSRVDVTDARLGSDNEDSALDHRREHIGGEVIQLVTDGTRAQALSIGTTNRRWQDTRDLRKFRQEIVDTQKAVMLIGTSEVYVIPTEFVRRRTRRGRWRETETVVFRRGGWEASIAATESDITERRVVDTATGWDESTVPESWDFSYLVHPDTRFEVDGSTVDLRDTSGALPDGTVIGYKEYFTKDDHRERYVETEGRRLTVRRKLLAPPTLEVRAVFAELEVKLSMSHHRDVVDTDVDPVWPFALGDLNGLYSVEAKTLRVLAEVDGEEFLLTSIAVPGLTLSEGTRTALETEESGPKQTELSVKVTGPFKWYEPVFQVTFGSFLPMALAGGGVGVDVTAGYMGGGLKGGYLADVVLGPPYNLTVTRWLGGDPSDIAGSNARLLSYSGPLGLHGPVWVFTHTDGGGANYNGFDLYKNVERAYELAETWPDPWPGLLGGGIAGTTSANYPTYAHAGSIGTGSGTQTTDSVTWVVSEHTPRKPRSAEHQALDNENLLQAPIKHRWNNPGDTDPLDTISATYAVEPVTGAVVVQVTADVTKLFNPGEGPYAGPEATWTFLVDAEGVQSVQSILGLPETTMLRLVDGDPDNLVSV